MRTIKCEMNYFPNIKCCTVETIFGIYKQFHATLGNGSKCLPMLRFNLNHVSKWVRRCWCLTSSRPWRITRHFFDYIDWAYRFIVIFFFDIHFLTLDKYYVPSSLFITVAKTNEGKIWDKTMLTVPLDSAHLYGVGCQNTHKSKCHMNDEI